MLMLKDARVVSTEKKKNTYLIIYAVTIILVWIIISMFIRTTKVDGTSMMPTLKNNDLLLTISSKYHEIKHGDIVAINSSATNCYIIKRVIAIDGDEIEITDDGKVYLNNELLKEPYLNTLSTSPSMKLTVPKNCVFVMGDNREVSNDSRYFGCVNKDEIISIFLFNMH